MAQSANRAVSGAVRDARELLDQIVGCKAQCRRALRPPVVAMRVAAAAACCDELGYDGALAEEVRALHGRVMALKRQVETLVDNVLSVNIGHAAYVKQAAEGLVRRCEGVSLRLPAIAVLQDLLAKSEDELLHEQLSCAIRNRDVERTAAITLKSKELFFAKRKKAAEAAAAAAAEADRKLGGRGGDSRRLHGGAAVLLAAEFGLKNYANVKPPRLFAKCHGVRKPGLERNMLLHTRRPLHTCLTRMDDPRARRAALHLFKNVLGYCGDRPGTGMYPAMLAREILDTGTDMPELRDEIYVQIMKQLTDNPREPLSAVASKRGWNLMALCLSTFPPSDQLENYLESFLRENGQHRSVKKLHKVVFRGAASTVPSAATIEGAKDKGHRFSIVQW